MRAILALLFLIHTINSCSHGCFLPIATPTCRQYREGRDQERGGRPHHVVVSKKWCLGGAHARTTVSESVRYSFSNSGIDQSRVSR